MIDIFIKYGLTALIQQSSLAPNFQIDAISTGGAGCPSPDTVTPIVADDGSSFLLLFDSLQLDYPPGSATQAISCAAAVELDVPDGWQLTLGTVTTRGYAYLDAKIRARASSRYFLAGEPLAKRPHAVLHGPLDELYEFTDKVPFGPAKWSACGGSVTFTVETTLKLDASKNPDGLALFGSDSIDGAVQQLYRWKWREC